MMTCDQCRTELAEQALGQLSAQSAAAVDEHLTACPVCRHEAAGILEAWSALPMALKPIIPPADLFDRIVSRLDGANTARLAPARRSPPKTTPCVRSSLSKRQRIWSYALAASIFIGLTTSFVQLMRPSADAIQSARFEQLAKEYRELLAREQRRSLGSNFRLIEMSGPTAAEAFVIWDLSGQQWHFHVIGLPPASPDQAYQLWALTESGPIPGPTFLPNAQGVGSVAGSFPHLAPEDGVRAVITLEPVGGSPRPTGAPLLEAKP